MEGAQVLLFSSRIIGVYDQQKKGWREDRSLSNPTTNSEGGGGLAANADCGANRGVPILDKAPGFPGDPRPLQMAELHRVEG